MRLSKKLGLILIASLVLIPALACADTLNMTNATSRDITDVAYPELLFYVVLAIGGFCLIMDIVFLASSNGVPVSAFVLTSTLGFCTFFIAAYMAPLTAKMSWVVSGTEVRFVSQYIFSPWVSLLLQALGLICFVLVWYGVILYLRLIKHNKKQLERDEMFAITGIDMD